MNPLDAIASYIGNLTGHGKLVSPRPEDNKPQKKQSFGDMIYNMLPSATFDTGPIPQHRPTQPPVSNMNVIVHDKGPQWPDLSSQPLPEVAGATTSVPADLQTIGNKIFDAAGIPRAVGWGQFAAEGRGKGKYASRNNFFNINANDSNPDAAFSYPTPEAGFQAYANLLKQKYPQAMKLASSPVKMIKAIEQGGYAGDPKTYSQRATAANPATGQKYNSYSQFVMDTPEFQSNL